MADEVAKSWDSYIDEKRLALVREDAIDSDGPVIDPHHHLWASVPMRYGLAEWLMEIESGHRVIATVHIDAHHGYRTDGPEHLKPVGETEFVLGIGKEAEKFAGSPKICAAMVGGGDLACGEDKVNELLEAHIAAGEGRFRGIRISPFWAFDDNGFVVPTKGWQESVEGSALATGIKCLGSHRLLLEVVAHHKDLVPIARLAQRHEDVIFVVNHMAPPKDSGANARPEAELVTAWRHGIDEIALRPNIRMKLGGAANPIMSTSMPAFNSFRQRDKPPSSSELADAYRPYVSYCIERLGPYRCMFESNFPVDKSYCSYVVVWNAFKRLAGIYGREEKEALLRGTAAEVYRLEV